MPSWSFLDVAPSNRNWIIMRSFCEAQAVVFRAIVIVLLLFEYRRCFSNHIYSVRWVRKPQAPRGRVVYLMGFHYSGYPIVSWNRVCDTKTSSADVDYDSAFATCCSALEVSHCKALTSVSVLTASTSFDKPTPQNRPLANPSPICVPQQYYWTDFSSH